VGNIGEFEVAKIRNIVDYGKIDENISLITVAVSGKARIHAEARRGELSGLDDDVEVEFQAGDDIGEVATERDVIVQLDVQFRADNEQILDVRLDSVETDD